nr:cyclin-dependent kinase 1 isoform X1 [Arachis hypogaea]
MEEESESVRVKDIILKRKIGNGSFSAVWRAEHRGTGEEVAVKQVFLSKLNLRLKSLFHCELNFLSSVNHPNIVRLLDFFQLNSRMAYTEPYLNHKLCPLSKIQVPKTMTIILEFRPAQMESSLCFYLREVLWIQECTMLQTHYIELIGQPMENSLQTASC